MGAARDAALQRSSLLLLTHLQSLLQSMDGDQELAVAQAWRMPVADQSKLRSSSAIFLRRCSNGPQCWAIHYTACKHSLLQTLSHHAWTQTWSNLLTLTIEAQRDVPHRRRHDGDRQPAWKPGTAEESPETAPLPSPPRRDRVDAEFHTVPNCRVTLILAPVMLVMHIRRLKFGDPTSVLPILSYILTSASLLVAEEIIAAGYEVRSSTNSSHFA